MRNFAYQEDKFIPALQLATVIYDLSKLRGVNEHRLLKGTGIFKEDLVSSDIVLSPQQILSLLSNFRDLMPGQNSSFLLGHRLFPTTNAALNGCLTHGKNLRQVIRLLALIKMQLCPFIHSYFQRHQQTGYLFLNDAVGCKDLYPYLLEIYCTGLVSISKYLVGKRIPFSFTFPFSRPRHIQEYEENLGFRLSFNQPMLTASFDLKMLDTPLAASSQTLFKHAKHNICHQTSVKYGFVELVRNHIYFQNMNLAQVAEKLNVSPATLKRKLNQHHTNFQSLQDQVNRQRALFMLRIKNMKNEAIASELAFNDVTNFRRAFKRWTGVTPSQLRV